MDDFEGHMKAGRDEVFEVQMNVVKQKHHGFKSSHLTINNPWAPSS
jgi:hypothetical protein